MAIDVNTGRYVGKKSAGRLEDTIVKTNVEAVKEIVRQVRLRDLGGIIVLDFIDMEEKKNRQKVLQAVELELKKDRSPSKALQVSDFGLIIITRKRVKQSLERVMTNSEPTLKLLLARKVSTDEVSIAPYTFTFSCSAPLSKLRFFQLRLICPPLKELDFVKPAISALKFFFFKGVK